MLFLKHFSSRYLCHQWVTRQDLLNAGPVRSDWGLPRPCPAQLRSEESENNGASPSAVQGERRGAAGLDLGHTATLARRLGTHRARAGGGQRRLGPALQPEAGGVALRS